VSQTFEELLAIVNADFYKSDVSYVEKCRKPTFFYHVPKCGGMSFYYSILGADELNKKLPESQHVLIKKYDKIENKNYMKGLKITERSLIMSHLSYGTHKTLGADFHLVTMLREPFSRTLSNYTYLCMRQQTLPSIDGFEKFYQDEDNINVMNKQLSPNLKKVNAELTFNHLQSKFRFYGTTAHITSFIEHYISEYQLPNVLMEHMNQTLPKYKLDISSLDKGKFYSLNKEDLKLFELVSSQPRLPKKQQYVENVNNHTSLIYETEKELRTQSAIFVITTQALFHHLYKVHTQHGSQVKLNVSEMLS